MSEQPVGRDHNHPSDDCSHTPKGPEGGPLIETSPLPAGAQFLNVIESVFSGMARAIIHNSDYKSMDVAKAAIDAQEDVEE